MESQLEGGKLSAATAGEGGSDLIAVGSGEVAGTSVRTGNEECPVEEERILSITLLEIGMTNISGCGMEPA